MKVLIASDRIGRLGPAEASDVVAEAFAARGAQVAVTPLALGGPDLADAIARFAPRATIVRPKGLDDVPAALTTNPTFLDLTTLPIPALDEVVALPSPSATTTTAIFPAGLADKVLTGLTGALAELGRETTDLAATLAADDAARAWLEDLGLPDAPGCGAHGGLGAYLLAAGATVTTGVAACLAGYRLAEVAQRADLLVTGCDVLDFHNRGGDVVRAVTDLAGRALRPVIVLAGANFVSARELRLSGIEEAHAVFRGAADHLVEAAELATMARKVAVTWRW